MIRTAPLALLLTLALAGPAFADEVRPPGDFSPLGNELLSDEFKVSRWAHPYDRAKIKSQPKDSARTKGRLRLQTEDNVQEVYLVLRSKLDAKDDVWLQIRIPARPNGQTGWVREEALGPLNVVRTSLTINRKALKATLYNKGKKVWSSRVGIGKPGTPTPAGRFWIRERLKALGGVYGPWAFGTAAYSNLSDWPGGGVVGIHGTNQPELIPGRPSHGCVRVPNHKIEQLKRKMPIGTPVRII